MFLVVNVFAGGPVNGVHAPTEISVTDPSVRMSFYPNPCPKLLNVDILFEKNISQVEIHFRSIIGKDILPFIFDEKASTSNHYEFDLSDVPAGIFLLEVVTYNNGVASKMIKRVTKL